MVLLFLGIVILVSYIVYSTFNFLVFVCMFMGLFILDIFEGFFAVFGLVVFFCFFVVLRFDFYYIREFYFFLYVMDGFRVVFVFIVIGRGIVRLCVGLGWLVFLK